MSEPAVIDLPDEYYSNAELRVVQRARQLKAEREEARQVAVYLMKHSVDCLTYQAELIEAYPWMKEAQ